MTDGKQRSGKSGWGYRLLLGLFGVCFIVLGGVFLLYLSLPFLAEYFGKRWIAQKLDAPIQLEVATLTPWQIEVDSFAVEEAAGGLNLSLNGVEARYDPDSIQKSPPLKYLGIQRGEFGFSLDSYLEPPATASTMNPEAPWIAPLASWPIRRWNVDQLILKPSFKDQQWQAEIQGYGLFRAPSLDQALELKVPEWDLNSKILGSLDLNQQDWSVDWDGEIGNPRKVFEEIEQFLDIPWSDAPFSWSWNRLAWEGQVQGQSLNWKRFHSVLDGGPGTLEWAGGNLRIEGMAGAVLVDDPDWNSTFARLHLLIGSLEVESLLESREFAIEIHKMRNNTLLSRLGPLSLQWQSGNLELEVVGETELDAQGVPTALEVRLHSPFFHHQEARIDLTGSAETTLHLQENKSTDSVFGKLQWDIHSLQGVWEPVFIESFSSRGSFRNLELPDSSLVSLISEWKALREMDWIKKVEEEFQGETFMEFKGISIPGQGLVEEGRITLERNETEAEENPFQFKFTSDRARLGGFSVPGMELLGTGSRKKGNARLALLKPSGGRAEATINYEHSAAKGYTWGIDVPRVNLENEGWLGGIRATFLGSKLGGDVAFSGSGRFQWPTEWDGSGELSLQALNFEWPAQDLKFQGLHAGLKFSGLNPLSLPEDQLITIDRLEKGDLEATNLRLRVGKRKGEAIQISGFQGRIFDGSVAVDRFEIDLEKPTLQLVLHLNAIALEKVVELAKDFPGTLQGKVNGVLRVGWDGKEISFGRGYLELVPGTEGRLELHLDKKPTQKDDDPYAFLQNLAQQQTAVESLRLVRLESAKFDLFNPENPENPNQLRLKGVSLSLKPQTPVDITLNLKEDVEESIRQLIKVFLSVG